MKRLFLTTVTVFFYLIAPAQLSYVPHSEFEKHVLDSFVTEQMSADNLAIQAAVDHDVNAGVYNQIQQTYHELLGTLKARQARNQSDRQFLTWMFYKVHRKYLKAYKQYSTVADMFEDGKYDCLTATSLYSLLLHDLGYEPQVIETDYHIYVMVTVDGQHVLIESTDPINGIVFEEAEIALRVANYEVETPSENEYGFNQHIHASVALKKLAGLHYYNAAVTAYNKQALVQTLDLLEKSVLFYHSTRIVEFGTLLANAIAADQQLSQEMKQQSFTRIKSFLEPVTATVASR